MSVDQDTHLDELKAAYQLSLTADEAHRTAFAAHQAGEWLNPIDSDLREQQRSLAEMEQRRLAKELGDKGLGRFFRRRK